MVDVDRGVRRTSGVWRVIRLLIARPTRVDRALPIVWLVRPAVSVPVLELLAQRVGAAVRGRVPHTYLDMASRRGGQDIRQLLFEVCSELAADRFGIRPLRFRRFLLADFIMGLDLSSVSIDQRRGELLRRLRHAGTSRPAEGPDAPAESWYGTGSQLLSWLVRRVVPTALFRVWASGRLPFSGNPYRWFLRQRYLAPQQANSFAGFAVRLTSGPRAGEIPGELDKLLMHAFLEDLRRAYRRWPWRLAGWRRTAYAVVLLDNVAAGGAGQRLLDLLSEVRNETGQLDPLLVVGTADEPPQLGGTQTVIAADDAEDELEVWAETLPQKRRVLDKAAWYLTIDLPDPAGTPVTIRARAVPWFARRAVTATLVIALLATAAYWSALRWGWDLGCMPTPLSGGHASVRLIGDQCIGYSDNSGFLFGEDSSLRAIQQRIFDQNREVDQLIDQQPTRPRATLIYLGTLTGRLAPKNIEPYVAEREELEGMAVVQNDRMKADSQDQTLLRIVVANGGYEMRYANQVADLLAGLVRQDPTVLGVVGLVESRTNTIQALKKLNQLGLLSVAPTLSADQFYKSSRLYLQIAPPNRDQAKLIASYARDILKVNTVHTYYTTGSSNPVETLKDDLYVKTLLEDLKAELGTLPQYVEQPYYRQSALTHECKFDGMLLFAGRWTEFEDFVNALKVCGEKPPFHLVAGDSVNRYMANTRQRGEAYDLPLAYVSKAALASCERLNEASGERREFRDLLRRDQLLPRPRCHPGHKDPDTAAEVPVGERVALAYDATAIITDAIDRIAARRPDSDQRWEPAWINSVGVHAELLRIYTPAPVARVTGAVQFNPDTGEPINKRISLIKVDSIRISTTDGQAPPPPREHYACGLDHPDSTPQCALINN